MFENFVTFTEVVKLSSIIFHNLRNLNYCDKLLDSIYGRNDQGTFYQVMNLIEDGSLTNKFIYKLDYCCSNCKTLSDRWFELLVEFIKRRGSIDLSTNNYSLFKYAYKEERLDVIELIGIPSMKLLDDFMRKSY